MDKNKQARIDELLNYENREYSIDEQKAELLCRNKAFVEDCGKLETYFLIRHRLGWTFEGMIERSKGKKKYPTEEEVLAEFGLKRMPEHDWFYEKWSIWIDWAGEQFDLNWSVYAGPKLCALSPFEEHPLPYETITLNGNRMVTRKEWFRRDAYIVIDPWTTGDDIEKLCKNLPEVKEACFGFSVESKSFFARDLCWYDLSTEFELNPTQVAKMWTQARPGDFREYMLNTRDVRDEAKKLHVAPAEVDVGAFVDAYISSNLPQAVRSAVNRMRLMIKNLSKRPRSRKQMLVMIKNILKRKGFHPASLKHLDDKAHEWLNDDANEEELKRMFEKEGGFWEEDS
jgi:hypothetical protein